MPEALNTSVTMMDALVPLRMLTVYPRMSKPRVENGLFQVTLIAEELTTAS